MTSTNDLTPPVTVECRALGLQQSLQMHPDLACGWFSDAWLSSRFHLDESTLHIVGPDGSPAISQWDTCLVLRRFALKAGETYSVFGSVDPSYEAEQAAALWEHVPKRPKSSPDGSSGGENNDDSVHSNRNQYDDGVANLATKLFCAPQFADWKSQALHVGDIVLVAATCSIYPAARGYVQKRACCIAVACKLM